MLMLIRKGGEGKSRIGVTMRTLFGDSMNSGSLQEIEKNRFVRANLEFKLVFVSDVSQKLRKPSASAPAAA